jgi:HPt (histidine-containing phosphotransfer) domain-containing protein
MGASGQERMAEAMSALLKRFQPLLEERVAVVESAAAAAAKGTLDAEQRQQGCAAAHKLAGVLGTFGFQEGTDLAREAEAIFGTEQAEDSQEALRLEQIAARLREMLAAIPQG